MDNIDQTAPILGDDEGKLVVNLDNESRAATGLRALEAVQLDTMSPTDLAYSIVDLVADLLHLARQNDIEPDSIIRMAQMHFDAEFEEEAKGQA